MNTRDPPSGNPLCKQSFRFSLDLCWYLWDGFTSSKKNHHGGDPMYRFTDLAGSWNLREAVHGYELECSIPGDLITP